jgi:hypothetical protein
VAEIKIVGAGSADEPIEVGRWGLDDVPVSEMLRGYHQA